MDGDEEQLVSEFKKLELSGKLLREPLLQENPDRFVLFPIQIKEAFAFYKEHVSAFWILEEIDFQEDLVHWRNKLNDDERKFIMMVLAFFASADGIVSENLILNFKREFQIPEIRYFYGFQEAMENIHAETYAMMIDIFVKDPEEKRRLFHALNEIECVKKKAEWALKYAMSKYATIHERLVAICCFEWIHFSGAFCSIFWLKKRGLMPGLTKANEFISRDEGLHCRFAVWLLSVLENKLPKERIQQIVREAIEVEEEFIKDALPVRLLGMNDEQMTEYIKFVADKLLVALNVDKIYNTQNPFDWMELISVEGKANFFERPPSQYAKAGVRIDGEMTKGAVKFEKDEDF